MNGKRRQYYFSMVGLFILFFSVFSYYYFPSVMGDTVLPLKYADYIRAYSIKYDVDPSLVAAVIMQESRFNPSANSGAGAQGLMQFMPGTAATMARETGRWPKYDIYDAETSVEFGAAHLRDLLVKYNGNVDAALAGYNAGTGNADKWVRSGILDRIPFKETNNYVKKVKNYQKIYRAIYANELGLEPIMLEENKATDSEIRGFVWTQVFTNFAAIIIKDKK